MKSNRSLSRISKLFVDRDQIDVGDALTRRKQFVIDLVCGPDVERSYTLQLAALTAANIAKRCFPGAIRVVLGRQLADAPLLLWPYHNRSFGQTLAAFLGSEALRESTGDEANRRSVIFGNAMTTNFGLRATFDGWIAKVGPAQLLARLPEREYCPLSGVLAGSLAISELFLSFAEISIEATRRTVGLSLWQPDADPDDASALGIPLEFLPEELWVLGLGHLGNAYLWSLGTLPYANPAKCNIYLNDYDKIEAENVETGLLFSRRNIGAYKTRTSSRWLERLGFQTRMVERPFDSDFRCRTDEPRLAFCGFDSNPARRDLPSARFLRVVESGLGGTQNNFDTISLHTLPNPRTAGELWPDLSDEQEVKRIAHQKQVATENGAYSQLGKDECGLFELAGKSVAVPFVGAAAGALVVAESLRMFHDGPAFTDIKLALSVPAIRAAKRGDNYRAVDTAGLNFSRATGL